jgi:hypothetical protein
MQTKFKAPQRKLQSSWRSEVFKKPSKSKTVVNRSLGIRANAVVKSSGSFVQKDGCNSGYLY